MKIMRSLASALGTLTNVFINRRTTDALSKLIRVFYTSWVRREFAFCGRDCTFGGFAVLCGAKYIHLGSNLYIGKDVVWEVYDEFRGQTFMPLLSFGDDSSFGDGGHITCINRVVIGNGVRIGRKVFITDNSHGASERVLLDTPPNLRPLVSKGPVVIEDCVWIGEMACIMPGVTIGRGAIVGANAVVTHDVLPYTLVAGNPARMVKRID